MAEEIEIIVTATGFDKVSSGLKNTTDALKSTATEAKKTGDALKSSLNAGSAQAGQSIQNLSRIASDAPYGFIGIENNINPLVESFGRLRAETGSTGGALKALVGGLSGAGGLGLAFSAVTAAITFAQIGFSAWNRTAKATKETADETAKAMESITDSLAKEATKVTSLIAVLNNESESRERKLSALNELKKINPEIFGALELEKGKVEGLTTAYDAYIASLKNTLTAKLLQGRIEKELNELIKLQGGTLTETEKGILNIGNAINSGVVKNLQQFGSEGANAAIKLQEINTALDKKKQGNIDAVKGRIAALTTELSKLSQSIDLPQIKPDKEGKVKKAKKDVETLTDAYNAFIQELVNNQKLATLFNEPVLKKNIDSFENFIQLAVKKFNANATFTLPIVFELNTLRKSLEKAKPKDLVKSLQDQINLTPIEIPFTIPQGSIDNIKKQAVDITDALGAAVQSSIVAIGIGLGEALATGLTGGDLTSVFQALFNQLGGIISTLGEQVIAIGVAGILAQKAVAQALANPFLAIAAGVALVALGSLIKSSLSSQNKFAVGTRNAPGGMALVGERGPELVSLPRGSQVIPAAQTSNMLGGVGGGIEIYGILRGQDIYFSNKKYSATYARTT